MTNETHVRTKVTVPELARMHDVLGPGDRSLKFAKQYANLRSAAIEVTAAFVRGVRDGTWPDDAHSFH